ncbi:hypothetical protein MKZ38_008877 [Zalerion maritima]|uniref:Uncharacterized protein n=1 Tax=Zalerion maritima TaxID=339359 RepID=A0AAD5WUZ2_9PEZI|nr:hypothetical protein MKZ38_008877 [Zalerion maritima]
MDGNYTKGNGRKPGHIFRIFILESIARGRSQAQVLGTYNQQFGHIDPNLSIWGIANTRHRAFRKNHELWRTDPKYHRSVRTLEHQGFLPARTFATLPRASGPVDPRDWPFQLAEYDGSAGAVVRGYDDPQQHRQQAAAPTPTPPSVIASVPLPAPAPVFAPSVSPAPPATPPATVTSAISPASLGFPAPLPAHAPVEPLSQTFDPSLLQLRGEDFPPGPIPDISLLPRGVPAYIYPEPSEAAAPAPGDLPSPVPVPRLDINTADDAALAGAPPRSPPQRLIDGLAATPIWWPERGQILHHLSSPETSRVVEMAVPRLEILRDPSSPSSFPTERSLSGARAGQARAFRVGTWREPSALVVDGPHDECTVPTFHCHVECGGGRDDRSGGDDGGGGGGGGGGFGTPILLSNKQYWKYLDALWAVEDEREHLERRILEGSVQVEHLRSDGKLHPRA